MPRIIHPGQHVLTASVFLITNNEPVRRVLLRFHPKLGRWLQPGGHVESDQDPITAVVEECDCEVGIDISAYLKPIITLGAAVVLPPPVHLTTIHIPAGKPNPDDPEHYMVDMGYLVRLPHQEVRAGVEADWVDKPSLRKYDPPKDVRYFLEHHL
jgi:8-oxo-dGTP pyrophosphatase MutT (NUDIX family)